MTSLPTSGLNKKRESPHVLNSAMGHIRGKIVDRRGRGLAGCTIRARENGRFARSDCEGNFIMINLPPATYTFEVEHRKRFLSGMWNLPVKTGDNPGLKFALEPYRSVKRSFAKNIIDELFIHGKEPYYGTPCTS